jgi:hypothetical protein
MTLVHTRKANIHCVQRTSILAPWIYLGGLQPFIQIARKMCAVSDDVHIVCLLFEL